MLTNTQAREAIADYALRDAVNRTSKTIMQAGQDGGRKAKRAPKGPQRWR